MTANPQPILDFIIHDMNRSATVEKAYGAYTHHELCFALLRPKCTGYACFFTFHRLLSVFFYNFSVIP